MPALETRLVISADDLTSAAFAAVEQRLVHLQAAVSAANKVTTPSAATMGAFAGPGASLIEHADAMATQAAAADRAAVAAKAAAVANDAAASSMMGTAVKAGAVVAVYEAIKDTITAGADYQTELAKMQNAGIVGAEREAADRQALELSGKYLNVGRVEAMEAYRTVRSVAGRPDEVPGLMPTVIGALSSMKSLGLDVESMPNLYKAAETLGQTRDPEKFRRFLDSFVKAEQYSGHTINPEEIQRFAQQMKLSGAVVSDKFIESMMFLLTQETGSRGGAGLAGELQTFAGHITGKQAAEWLNLGFLKDEDVLRSRKGDVLGIKPDHNIKGWEQALSDPDLFVWEKLKPAMEEHGITSMIEQIKEVQALFGAQRASSIIGKLIQQEQQFKTHLDNLQGVAGIAGADTMLETPYGGASSLAEQLKNLAGIVSGPAIGEIGHGMAATARGLGGLNIMIGTQAPSEYERYRAAYLAQGQYRPAVMERFPGAFGGGVDARDAERLSRHAIEESYRRQGAIAGDREAHRGAALMGMPGPASVSLSGAAAVAQTLHIDISLDPGLQATVGAGTNYDFSVPLAADTGQMDTDASPRRGGAYSP